MDFQSGIMKVLVIKIALINLWLPLNINKGRIGYEYGYGASDVEREPIALYISSVKAEHYAPCYCARCYLFLMVVWVIFVRRSAERTDKKVIELRTEVEKLEQITQHLDERRKQQERIINDFDPDTLKCKSADLLEEIRKSENKLCELRNVKSKTFFRSEWAESRERKAI